MTIKAHLWKLFDEMPSRVISGWDIHELMFAITGRRTYPGTLLEYVREYCDIAGASFECIDRVESKYLYTPGFKISGSLKGKE